MEFIYTKIGEGEKKTLNNLSTYTSSFEGSTFFLKETIFYDSRFMPEV